MGELPGIDLESLAAPLLRQEWTNVQNAAAVVSPDVPGEARSAIFRSIESKTKTYRYVLPTQLLAKATNPALDCRAVQANAPLEGAFDARSLCQKVIVPFERNTENVLGGSPEPYANNPVRIQAILANERPAQKDKAGFDDLVLVLEYAQANPTLAMDLLRIVLRAILARLATVSITYPVPNRVSQAAALACVSDFLNVRTGGTRLQAIAVALFRAIGGLYGQFPVVQSNNINAADSSTGSAADLECVAANGKIVKAVEVKDRQLALLHVQVKLAALREKQITEAIFVVQGGTVPAERDQIMALIQKEFGSGQNIYVVDFMAFLENHLVVFGEEGRRQFLRFVGEELDQRNADVSHRQRWRDRLVAI